MSRSRWVVLASALALAATLLEGGSAVAAPGQQQGSPEVGVTADTIRIAVIADVDNQARPGLFQGSVRGVQAAAKYINGHGGLAGRKVQVDFIDSHLSADDARTALLSACQEDFAIVGTTALFMQNVDPMLTCADKTGKATGLPDVPVLQTEIAHQCSPVSFPIISVGLDCKTKDQPEKTVSIAPAGLGYYKKHFKDLHGDFLLASDLKSTLNSGLGLVAASKTLGYKVDDTFRVSGLDPQAAYTPRAQTIKQENATFVSNGVDYKADVLMRREARVQGVTNVKVWDCTLACYDRRLLTEGGQDVEGQYLSIRFVPFEEAKQSKSVSNYLDAVGGRGNADGFGAQAWDAGLFFRDVVGNVVKANGNDGLTRARFLEEAAKIHDFTADGMLGPTDVGGRKPNGCFVLMQVKGGKFVRVFPTKKGTIDCSGQPIDVKVKFE